MKKQKMVMVKTYYTLENGTVIEHKKIGNGKWLKAVTPYKEIPFVEWKGEQL